jgi:hypothetical protein
MAQIDRPLGGVDPHKACDQRRVGRHRKGLVAIFLLTLGVTLDEFKNQGPRASFGGARYHHLGGVCLMAAIVKQAQRSEAERTRRFKYHGLPEITRTVVLNINP